jgi:hypothetical protein
MAHLIKIIPNKTYLTRANAVKAVEKKIAPDILPNLRYFIHTDFDGRYFPVFIGQEAVTAGVHMHFNIVG